MKNAIIFTGLPRNLNRFKTSVSEMNSLSNQGLINKIIFSTWHGRLDNAPKFKRIIENNNIDIVENKESPVGGRGNKWHQMRSLEYGLQEISSNYRVLRTRSDVHIKKDFLHNLLTCSVAEEQKAESDVFNEKIWAPFTSINIPFNICDYCLFGTKTDVEKLVNFDSRYEYLYDYSGPATEVQMFSNPYLEKYNFLEKYWLYYRHDSPVHCEDYAGLIKSRLKSPTYGLFLAFYFKVLISDFYYNESAITFRGDNNLVDPGGNIIKKIIDNIDRNADRRIPIRTDDNNWLNNELTDNIQEYPEPISNGIPMTFNDWSHVQVETENIIEDMKRDKKFFDTTSYPEGNTVRKLKPFLEKLGVKEKAKYIYKNLT